MQKTYKGNKIYYTKKGSAYIQKRNKKTNKLRKIYITKKLGGINVNTMAPIAMNMLQSPALMQAASKLAQNPALMQAASKLAPGLATQAANFGANFGQMGNQNTFQRP